MAPQPLPRFSDFLRNFDRQLAGDFTPAEQIAVAVAAVESRWLPEAIAAALPSRVGPGRLVELANREADTRGEAWASEHLREAIADGLPTIQGWIERHTRRAQLAAAAGPVPELPPPPPPGVDRAVLQRYAAAVEAVAADEALDGRTYAERVAAAGDPEEIERLRAEVTRRYNEAADLGGDDDEAAEDAADVAASEAALAEGCAEEWPPPSPPVDPSPPSPPGGDLKPDDRPAE